MSTQERTLNLRALGRYVAVALLLLASLLIASWSRIETRMLAGQVERVRMEQYRAMRTRALLQVERERLLDPGRLYLEWQALGEQTPVQTDLRPRVPWKDEAK